MLACAALIAPGPALLRFILALWGIAVALALPRLAHSLVAMRFISSTRPAFLDAAREKLRLVRRSPPPSLAATSPVNSDARGSHHAVPRRAAA